MVMSEPSLSYAIARLSVYKLKPNCDVSAFHHLISDSLWEAAPLEAERARRAWPGSPVLQMQAPAGAYNQ